MSGAGNALRVEHVGIVVRDIQAHFTKFLKPLLPEAELGPVILDPIQKVRVAFIELNGGRFELIEPAAADSPISAVLRRKPAGFHHVCFEVDDLDSKVRSCEQARMALICPPVPAVAFSGRRIAFVMTLDTLLWELLEREAR